MPKSNASDSANNNNNNNSTNTPKRHKSSKTTGDRPSKKSKSDQTGSNRRSSSSSAAASSLATAAAAAAPKSSELTSTTSTPMSTTATTTTSTATATAATTATPRNKSLDMKIPKKTDASRGDSLATILPKKKDAANNNSSSSTSHRNNNTPTNNASKSSKSHPKGESGGSSSKSAAERRKETKSPLATTTPASSTVSSAASTPPPPPVASTPTVAPQASKTTTGGTFKKEDDAKALASATAAAGSSKAQQDRATDDDDDSSPSVDNDSSSKAAEDYQQPSSSAGSSDAEAEDQPKKKKGRPPKIETTMTTTMADDNTPAATAAAAAATSSAVTPTGKSPATSGGAQDQHPYARSSVIEVWHGVEDPSEDSWWTEDSDSDEETITATHRFKAKQGKQASVRLCDVIDRVPIVVGGGGGGGSNNNNSTTSGGKWRYYVHYRDFNRRMDEWVSMERIVSPPSVGNAKARALKLEEEKQKRIQARKEEKKAEEAIDVSAPRASRRRTSMSNHNNQGNPSDTTTTPTAASAAGETPRQTRKQRRKYTDDDATVVMGNSHQEGGRSGTASNDPPATVLAAEKGIVGLPTEAVHTTSVGGHVVETIAAQELDEHEGLDEASLREHEEVTKVKNVAFIELGAFQMETWYFSPLPKDLLSERGLIEVLYVCEFTLNMFSRKSELRRFQSRLPTHDRHPPGNEIYRKGNIAMFEVDGFDERIYCQNLCYIAKLFLDHKTLYFDVDPFLFYVMCEVDERGFHPVGYYSKEKYSDVGYNLACILTFPCHQRKGYGRFLIAFSYELSKKEEKVGSPEKPMSDLGQQAYKPYWASTIVDFLLNQVPDASNMSIMDISKITSIMAEDIVFTLNQLGILKIINGVYFVAAEKGLLETLAKKYPVKKPRVDPSKLHWSPFVTDVKRDKFSIHSKKPSVEGDEMRGSGGF